MSKANAAKVKSALTTFMSWCVDKGFAPRNDLLGRRAKRTKREKEQVTIPTEKDVKALLVASGGLAFPYDLYVRLAVFTGCRAGELRGLHWSHVDLSGGTITISQRAEQNGNLGPPKSGTGNRTIPIPAGVVKALKERWLAAGRPVTGFVLPCGDKPLDHDNFGSRHWRPMLKRLGLSVRFHDLRHYYGSSLIARGVPITEVSRRLGHADPMITLRVYSHALPEDRGGEELDALEAALT